MGFEHSFVFISMFQEIQKVFYKKKRTEIKSSAGDPVTETDKLIEKIFVTTIKETYPNHR